MQTRADTRWFTGTRRHILRDQTAPLRIALYAHDTVGLGHTRRNLHIARTLTQAFPNASVLLLSGNSAAGQFSLPPNVDVMTLPALGKNGAGRYEARRLELGLAPLLKLRSDALWAALKSFAPDVLIVDHVPTGAAGELERSLKKLRKRGTTTMILGLRDILDAPEAVKTQWERARYDAAIDRYFDSVWVYGERAVYDLAERYNLSARTAEKLCYLGYFDGRERLASAHEHAPPALLRRGENLVLALVGGGEDGAPLARAFAQTEFPEGHYGVLVTGPHMPAQVRSELQRAAAAREDLDVVEFVKEPTRLLAAAERVVSMGGYNTTFETLSLDKALLMIPRITPRLEQYERAKALAHLGLLDYLHPDALSPTALGLWLRRPRRDVRARDTLRFSAAAQLVEALRRLHAKPLRYYPPQEVHHAAA